MSSFACIRRNVASDVAFDATLQDKLEITVDDETAIGANYFILQFTCVDSHDDFVKSQLNDLYHINHYVTL